MLGFMKFQTFLVASAALALMSASMVFGQPPVFNPGPSGWPPAKKQAFDAQIGQYGTASNALNAVFPNAFVPYTVSQSGTGNNVRYIFTVAPAVAHLWDVDAPVQCKNCQAYDLDCKKKCMIWYLTQRHHPTNGDVYMWYKWNYRL